MEVTHNPLYDVFARECAVWDKFTEPFPRVVNQVRSNLYPQLIHRTPFLVWQMTLHIFLGQEMQLAGRVNLIRPLVLRMVGLHSKELRELVGARFIASKMILRDLTNLFAMGRHPFLAIAPGETNGPLPSPCLFALIVFCFFIFF